MYLLMISSRSRLRGRWRRFKRGRGWKGIRTIYGKQMLRETCTTQKKRKTVTKGTKPS